MDTPVLLLPGEVLRAIRKTVKMTQRDFGRALGYSHSAIVSMCETGMRKKAVYVLLEKAKVVFKIDNLETFLKATVPNQHKGIPLNHRSREQLVKGSRLKTKLKLTLPQIIAGERLRHLRKPLKLEWIASVLKVAPSLFSRAENGWINVAYTERLTKKLEDYIDQSHVTD